MRYINLRFTYFTLLTQLATRPLQSALFCCNTEPVCMLIMLLVLSAINEDSPTVPALLTDYILNGTVSFVSSVLIFNFFLSSTMVHAVAYIMLRLRV